MYTKGYGRSFALVLGIDSYENASPLQFAVSDATSIAELLISRLGFQADSVFLLTDSEATKTSILQKYLSFTQNGTAADDRLLIFFAGHGHTVTSARGEVGFLVPYDGDASDLSSLIRWDELTRNADLIAAKHLLFIMDACYGGLAITRAFKPGSMRFLDNMLLRPARQVLTAGKADELVSDAGGPIPNHSVFTGHLIEALLGKALDNDGNLTANGVTAYVYQSVSRDPSSSQTPHYGYLLGDGDFIFLPLADERTLSSEEESEQEVLVSIPATLQSDIGWEMEDIERLKELLSNTSHKIQLRDFINAATRESLALTGEDYFSVQGHLSSNEMFAELLSRYEGAVARVLNYETLLGYWGQSEHLEAARVPFRRMSERLRIQAGSVHLNNLRWYPLFLMFYSHGLGAIASENYGALLAVFDIPVGSNSGKPSTLIEEMTGPLTEIHDLFKSLPGMENKRTPRSEYLFKLLQPQIDDLLFLGNEYESVFDRFELMYCLQHAFLKGPDWNYWGPIGRFAWKHRGPSSPAVRLRAEADANGDNWLPLKAGFFGGTYNQFTVVYDEVSKLISRSYSFF